MDKDIAKQLIGQMLACIDILNEVVETAHAKCGEDEARVVRRAVGHALSEMYDRLIDPIYREYPDLVPRGMDYTPPKGPTLGQMAKVLANDEMVCPPCSERQTVRDAFQHEVCRVFDLERRGQFEEALACLDEIWAACRDRDHDGWLARSVAHERAVLLFEAGRYAEALQVYEAWARLGFEDVSQRWMHGHGTALALEAVGRDREALAVLEEAFGHQDTRYLPSAVWVLTELVRLSEKVARPFDPKWLKVAEQVAERFGVDMPVRDSPDQAVLALAEAVRGKQPKPPAEW